MVRTNVSIIMLIGVGAVGVAIIIALFIALLESHNSFQGKQLTTNGESAYMQFRLFDAVTNQTIQFHH